MSEIPSFSFPDFSDDRNDLSEYDRLLEAEYQDKLHIFRARVLTEFKKAKVQGIRGWLLYSFEDGILEGSEDAGCDFADCVVLINHTVVADDVLNFHLRPSIRLIYSECYDLTEINEEIDDDLDRFEYFTVDISITEFGDAQATVSTYPAYDDAVTNLMYQGEDMAIPIPRVPLASRWKDSVTFYNMADRAEIDVARPSGSNDMVAPFGHHNCLTDKMYALERAIELFDKLTADDNQPIDKGTETHYEHKIY